MFKRMMMAVLPAGLVAFALSAAAGDAVRLAGQLSKIDGKALTITADGKQTVITCNDATKIGRDGGMAAFADLQVGQPVRAYYDKTHHAAKAVIIAKP